MATRKGLQQAAAALGASAGGDNHLAECGKIHREARV